MWHQLATEDKYYMISLIHGIFKKTNKNKLMEEEIRFTVTRCRRWGRGNQRKMAERYKLPIVRQISTRDGMYT